MSSFWQEQLFPIINKLSFETFFDTYADQLCQDYLSMVRYYQGEKPPFQVLLQLSDIFGIELSAVEFQEELREDVISRETASEREARLQQERLVRILHDEGTVVVNKANYQKWSSFFGNHQKIDDGNCWIVYDPNFEKKK